MVQVPRVRLTFTLLGSLAFGGIFALPSPAPAQRAGVTTTVNWPLHNLDRS